MDGHSSKRNKFSVLECISNAIHSIGRDARTVLRSLSSVFSCVRCVTEDIKHMEHHYARGTSGSHVDETRKSSESTPVNIFTEADVPFRSFSYDSLADETLSIRASTLTSPATTPRNTSSLVSYSSVSESESATSITSSESAESTVSTSFDQVIDSLLVDGSTAAALESNRSEMSNSAVYPCVSPISYYRSSTTDLRLEDVNETDEAFWDSTA